jgi:hypothetical protein
MNIDDFNKAIAILCAWREARGDGPDAMRAILHVIANRAIDRGKSWDVIVFQRLQFTSMTYGSDPELTLVPVTGDAQFTYLCGIVDEVYAGTDEDNTLGATNYFANYIPVPSWAKSMIPTVTIGKQTFYK